MTTLPPPDACLFDLDGTLVDSLQDIAESLNHCLDLLGFPAHPIDCYRYMVGEGVPTLCERAIGARNPRLVPRLIELVRPLYRARPMVHTRPFTGISELIRRLVETRIPLGVLSNKPHELTVKIVRAFWPDGAFVAIQGYVDESLRKPDPTSALRICAEMGADPRRTWLIGDTPTDIETARRGGLVPLPVAWGFRTIEDLERAGAEIIARTPADVFRLVEESRRS